MPGALRSCGAIGLALALCASTTSAQHAYPYFDALIPLELDLSRVVVIDDGAALAAPLAADATQALAGFGLDTTTLDPHPQPFTFMVDTPGWLAGEQGVRDLVGAIAKEGAVDFVSPMFFDERGDPLWITNDIAVRFVDGVTEAQAEQIVGGELPGASVSAANWSRVDGLHRFTFDTRDGFEVLEASVALSAHPLVAFAEPGMVMTLHHAFDSNDTQYNNLWGIKNTGQSGGTPDVDMDVDVAWDISTGNESIRVLILDDGVEQDHADLNQIPGADFTGSGSGGGPAGSCDNHGTNVAGCTSAVINNSFGVAGVSGACPVASAKFSISNPPCQGSGTFSPTSLVNAIEWGLNNGARVSNNSNSLGPSAAVTTKYSTSRAEGMVHFASTGNDGQGSIAYPSSLATVNAVGAITRFGGKASFSNFGSGIAFIAPGVDIVTTDRTGGDGNSPSSFATVDGTSFASPYATGVAALIVSVAPSLTPDEVEQIMEDTAKDFGAAGYDTLFGFGMPDADDAMLAAIGSVDPPGSFNVLAPTEGASDQPVDVLIAWLTASGADSFQITIDDTPDLSSPDHEAQVSPTGGPVTTYTPDPPLAPNTDYFLRVTAVNAGGQTIGNPSLVSFSTEAGCEGDLNGDQEVNSSDLNALLAVFGSDLSSGDVNNDGFVDSTDLNLLLANFGVVCN